MNDSNQSKTSHVIQAATSDAIGVRWRGKPTGRSEGRFSRIAFSAILILLLAGGLGTIIGILSFVKDRPQAHFVPIWGSRVAAIRSGLHGPIENDRLALTSTSLFGNVAIPDNRNPMRQQILDTMRQTHTLNDEDSLIVYVSTFATLDKNGDVFLIPGDSNPAIVEHRIYLKQLLTSLKQSPSSNKLLVLDIHWPFVLTDLTTHSNDVASQIQDLLNTNQDLDLLCISSCSAGQSGWTMTSPRRSVFGYFFEQGILGAADGASRHNRNVRDGRVSAYELAAFLASTVDEYSLAMCPTRQTPVLLGVGNDFDLVVNPTYRPAEIAQSPNVSSAVEVSHSTYPTWLAAAWKYRDEIANSNAWKIRPRFLSQCETAILQAELTWRRCGDWDVMGADLESRLKKLATDFNDQTRRYRAAFGDKNLLPLVAMPTINKITSDAADPAIQPPPSTIAKPNATPSSALPIQPSSAPSPGQDSTTSTLATASSVVQTGRTKEQQVGELLTELESFLAGLGEQRKVSDAAKWPQTQAKQVAEFSRQSSAYSNPEFSLAINRYIVEKPNLERRNLICLAQLWHQRPTPPIDVTNTILIKVADRLQAAPHLGLSSWNDLQIQQFLRLVAFSEQPFGRVRCWNQIGSIKSLVDDKRYVVENLFWHPGYIDESVLLNRSNAALADLVSVQALARRLESAYDTLDTSLWKLQHVFSMNHRVLHDSKPWLKAVEQTAALLPLVRATSDDCDVDLSDWTVLSKQVELIENKSMALQELQQQIFGQSNPAKINGFLKDIRYADLTDLNLRQIEDLLCTPWISYPHRRALHKALLRWPRHSNSAMMSGAAAVAIDPRAGMNQSQLEASKREAERRFHDRQMVAKALLCLNQRTESNLASNQQAEDARYAGYQGKWRHWAACYSKLSYDSPIAAVYQGLAQQYRQQAGVSAIKQFPMAVQSTDISLSPNLRESEHNIPLHLQQKQFRNVSFRSNNELSSTDPPRIQAHVLSTVSPTLDAKVSINDAGSQLVVNMSLDTASQSNAWRDVKGFFVELIVGDSVQLHRLNLPGLAQSSPIELSFGESPSSFDPAQRQIRLRPALQRQPLSLFAKNVTELRRECVVTLAGIETAVNLAPYQVQRVVFSGKPPKPNEPLPAIDNQIKVTVHDKATGVLLLEKSFEVAVSSPREYVEVVRASFEPYPSGGNRLAVTLRAQQPFSGPPCTARLILNDRLVPGLKTIQGGQLFGNIPPDGTFVTLYAENLKLSEQPDERGRFEVSVDGAPRTFVFDALFARQGNQTTPRLIHQPLIEIDADKSGLAGPGLPITIKPTNLPGDSELTLVLQRSGGSQPPDKRLHLPSPFETHLGLATNKQGDLLFSASIRDWTRSLNTSGLVGNRQWVCDAMLGDRVIVRHDQGISLDDQPPRSVRFTGLPQRAAAGQSLPVSITAAAGLTGIQSMQFFVGEPENGEPPKGTKLISCKKSGIAKGHWSGMLTLPKNPGQIQLTALAVNGAGLATFETAAIEIVSPAALNVGSVSGQVFEGTRAQPGLDVILKNSAGKIMAKTRSQFDGRFKFGAVPVGEYIVESIKSASGRHGAIRVAVKPGVTSGGDISLKL